MRAVLGLAIFGGLAAILAGSLPLTATAAGESCGSFGTSVEFVDTPSEAARQAKKQEKLVFVLHLSGIFEDPKLT
jgi:hypothetical protein